MFTSRRSGEFRKGFTIIELLTVIAIMAVLAGITIGIVRGVSERGRISRAQSELNLLAQGLEQYRSHYGDYPWVEGTENEIRLFNALAGNMGPRGHFFGTDDGQGRIFVNPTRFTVYDLSGEPVDEEDLPAPGEDPDRLEFRFVDPWGNPYRYYYKDENNSDAWERSGFVLYSMGREGVHNPPTVSGEFSRSHSDNADNIYHDD